MVDANGRKMSFGDDSPPFEVIEYGNNAQLKVNAFSSKKSMDITKLHDLWIRILDFCCIPTK